MRGSAHPRPDVADSTPAWPRRRSCRRPRATRLYRPPAPAPRRSGTWSAPLLLPLRPFDPTPGGRPFLCGRRPRTKGPAPPSASASGRRDSPAGPTRPGRSLLPPPPPPRWERPGRPGEAEGPGRAAWERWEWVWGPGGKGSFGGRSRVGPGAAGFKPALWRVLALFLANGLCERSQCKPAFRNL